MNATITAPALNAATIYFFHCMPGGDTLLRRIEEEQLIVITGQAIDHPFFDVVTKQWHVAWDEFESYFAALVPTTVAEILEWFSNVEDRDWSAPRRCPVPSWATTDMPRYASIVAEGGEYDYFWKIIEKVSWETRYGLDTETAFSVAKLACRLYNDATADDEDEAVEAAVEALTNT